MVKYKQFIILPNVESAWHSTAYICLVIYTANLALAFSAFTILLISDSFTYFIGIHACLGTWKYK